ncbi:hypothetical protein SPI_07338 [Niveomyces insectorum RCEF 264]|uniref:Uncharacterized protein n=1 Tax=Niveomyces insectorum RCEF 264 TaxID=1081102 RepID=A0A167PRV7_9HYPO|nr:hypothetical protein SPI_07338 [Niveomyces insectorum RCEF 264]
MRHDDGFESSRPAETYPRVYFHVEFGVAWSPRRRPKNHALTYQSRGLLHHRPASFPQDTAAAAAAAPPLANSASYQQRRNERHAVWEALEQQRRRQADSQPYGYYGQHGGTQHHQHHHHHATSSARRRSQVPLPPVDEGDGRSAQLSGDFQFLQARGHSEPPPLSGGGGGGPWDVPAADRYSVVVAAPYSAAGVGRGTRATPSEPRVWKALPENPSRYRLGEANLPWSVPVGGGMYEPGAAPDEDDDDDDDYERVRPRSQPAPGAASVVLAPSLRPFTNRPTVVPIEANNNNNDNRGRGTRRLADIDAQRRRNLEALSAALVTVDNGFESQWWNSGSRRTTEAEQPQPQPRPQQPPVWPEGMSASALPVPASLPASLRGVSDLGSDSDSPPPPPPAAPSGPLSPRSFRAVSLGWAVASASPDPPSGRAPPGPVVPDDMSPASSMAARHTPWLGSPNHRNGQVVSPVSEDGGSSSLLSLSPVAPTRRRDPSMAARSEELFLTTETRHA